jgi:acyl carrier protein phosphodiesterase
MNWLAHLFLSEPTPAFRIGNLLPDILRASEMTELPAEFQRGIECHREIDRFTDSHPVFRRSMRRIRPEFARYSGVLVDVFYDHLLARNWADYSDTALDRFASEVYASFEIHRAQLPAFASLRLGQIADADLFCSYREPEGIRDALERIGARFRKPVALGAAVSQLTADYDLFRQDFAEFFPAIRTHIASRLGN